MSPILEVMNVSAAYGRVPVLHNVSLSVDQGEFVVIMGPNGAGKTTLLRVVSGLVQPQRGVVRLRGEDITHMRAHRVMRRGLVHCPQGRQVFPDLTVEENLEMGAYPLLRRRHNVRARTAEVFELFPVLADRARQLARTLSGGQAQMLAIGRALMSRPAVLLLDEPTLGLAPLAVAALFRYLDEVHRREGLTTLIVEQFVGVALEEASRGYVLDRGEIRLEGVAADLRDSQFVRDVLLGADAVDTADGAPRQAQSS